MSNDRKASELLSKSFHGRLSSDEQTSLDESIAENDESATYARLSRMIQDSVADAVDASVTGDLDIEEKLSTAAKTRLLTSVRKAKRDSVGFDVTSAPVPSTPVQGGRRQAETRFSMLRKIGQGGLGVVWLARDEYINRTVAVKELISSKADSPKHLQRFQREAMITGLLEHPNVVPLYMFGVNSESGKPFYAMRFLGKQTLHDAIEVYHVRQKLGQAESIDLHRLLTVFLDVCQAIAYAHSRGVVHRDLKPDNVALDNFGQVIVLDWGIAKLLSDGELAIQASISPADSIEAILTRTVDGEVIGTPLYMAPEQALGEHDKVDERTDVFGLGAILYSILTGKAPHQESTVMTSASESISHVMQLIAESDIPTPGSANGAVSRDLEAICMRALSKHRYARHATAKELADDVERWMAGQHEKRKMFEAMRLEGSNIRVGLDSCIRDFGTNARFVATLPPIMGLIDSAKGIDDEGEAIWRERLTIIFRGLLRSNSDFQSITYSQVSDNAVNELVRVEKLGAESQAQAVPRSRLANSPLSGFVKSVIDNKPDDVRVAIEKENEVGDCVSPLLLQAGVPIFGRDEEPFGLVTLEGDFQRLFEKQFQGKERTTQRILVVDCGDNVLIDTAASGESGNNASEIVSEWEELKHSLSRQTDWLDRSGECYATRVALCPRSTRSLKVVLLAQ